MGHQDSQQLSQTTNKSKQQTQGVTKLYDKQNTGFRALTSGLVELFTWLALRGEAAKNAASSRERGIRG